MEMHKFEKLFVNSKFCNALHKLVLFPRFFDFINKELSGRALEIGCGIGETTKLISNNYQKLKIIAIDYDKEQIRIAKKNKVKNVKFFQGDAANINFKNNSFDYVIETDTLHHIKYYHKAVSEVHRVLKKNGTFYLIDISKYFFIWPIRLFFPPESSFSKKDFIKALEDEGFDIIKSKGSLLFFIAAKKA